MFKVSVVVPVYNPGDYFTPCIESLTSQSLPADEFEVICVDDGSTDDTPARLDELAATYRKYPRDPPAELRMARPAAQCRR